MEVVVNHLTRMKAPRICIAGLDRARARHVRPVTPWSDPLTRRLLTDEGGSLEIGAVIELGDPMPVPSPPESEDHRIATPDLKYVRTLNGDEYLDALAGVCVPDIDAAFGKDLERRDWKYAVEAARPKLARGGEGSPTPRTRLR